MMDEMMPMLNDVEMLEVVSNLPQNIKPDKSITIFLQAECHAIAKAQNKADRKWVMEMLNRLEQDMYALELDLGIEDLIALYGLVQTLKKALND